MSKDYKDLDLNEDETFILQNGRILTFMSFASIILVCVFTYTNISGNTEGMAHPIIYLIASLISTICFFSGSVYYFHKHAKLFDYVMKETTGTGVFKENDYKKQNPS